MSVSNYEEFLENPLKLDERLPTIEEVLLAMDTFLLRKADLTDNDENDKDSFRNVRNRLNEVKKGNNNIDKRDIFLWFKFFGLDKTQTNTFIEKYVKYLKAPMVRGSDKNFYIQNFMHSFFMEAFGLNQNCYSSEWMNAKPSDNMPFTALLKKFDFDEKTIKIENKDQEKILDNYRNWLDGATPEIDSLYAFLNLLEKVPVSGLLLQKEKILALWFWQKCNEKYPTTLNAEMTMKKEVVESKEEKELYELYAKIKGPKFPYSLQDNEEHLKRVKETFSPYSYPFIVLLEIKHLICKGDYSTAISYITKIIPFYFYVGDCKDWDWYILVLSVIAHEYNDDKNGLDKKAKKARKISLISLLKRIYNYGILYDIERLNFPLDNKEKENIYINNYNRRFNERLDFLHPYQKVDKSTTSIPKPNLNKPNKDVNFGNAKHCPPIVLFTQLNEPDHVRDLLKKGAQVANVSNTNDSALYWCLVNMDLSQHMSYAKTYLVPDESPLYNDSNIKEYIYKEKQEYLNAFAIAFISKNQFDEPVFLPQNGIAKAYEVFKRNFAKQIESAEQIFKSLLPHYRNPSRTNPHAIFSTTVLSNDSILNQAVCTCKMDVISAVVDLHKQYLGEGTIKEWMNKNTSYHPRTPLFWVVRQFEKKYNRPVYEKDFQNNPWLPIFDFDPADLADYWSMRSPNNPINYNENKIMAKQELSDRINMVFQNMQQVLEYKYLDDNVSEEEFLVILDYLLDNQASPITECDCTKINRPKDYNAGCLAAEIGWLNGVKKMAENIVKNESIDTVKREFSKWRDNARMFDREWSMGGFSGKSDHEIRAQRCREVAEYLQSLI